MSSTANLRLVIASGGCYVELDIDFRAGEWPLVQISDQGVLVIHPDPESQACMDFLFAAVQSEVRHSGEVMWVLRHFELTARARIEADAIVPEAPPPAIIARHDAGLNALFEKHR